MNTVKLPPWRLNWLFCWLNPSFSFLIDFLYSSYPLGHFYSMFSLRTEACLLPVSPTSTSPEIPTWIYLQICPKSTHFPPSALLWPGPSLAPGPCGSLLNTPFCPFFLQTVLRPAARLTLWKLCQIFAPLCSTPAAVPLSTQSANLTVASERCVTCPSCPFSPLHSAPATDLLVFSELAKLPTLRSGLQQPHLPRHPLD